MQQHVALDILARQANKVVAPPRVDPHGRRGQAAPGGSDWSHCHSAARAIKALLAYYAVQLVDKHRIPGAIVEAGVWKGGMSCPAARAHRRRRG